MAGVEKEKMVTLFVRVRPMVHKHLAMIAARRGIPKEKLYRECMEMGLQRWYKQGEGFDVFGKRPR